MIENYKFGYKLVNKILPTKTQQLCYLDNKNESLKKKHHYNTRNKELPNLPTCGNKAWKQGMETSVGTDHTLPRIVETSCSGNQPGN